MKKYFASAIIAVVIVSTSLVSCEKDVPAISTVSATHSTVVPATDMAPKQIIIHIDTSATKQGQY